jgi:hypothetical protein
MNADTNYAHVVLLRDHSVVSTKGPKTEKNAIENLADIIEHKPPVKQVREYFKKVLENIAIEDDKEFKS